MKVILKNRLRENAVLYKKFRRTRWSWLWINRRKDVEAVKRWVTMSLGDEERVDKLFRSITRQGKGETRDGREYHLEAWSLCKNIWILNYWSCVLLSRSSSQLVGEKDRSEKCDQQFKCGARVVTQCQSRLRTRSWSLTWNYSSATCLCTANKFQIDSLVRGCCGLFASLASSNSSDRAKVSIVRRSFSVFSCQRRFSDNSYKPRNQISEKKLIWSVFELRRQKMFEKETKMQSGKAIHAYRSQTLFHRISSSIPLNMITFSEASRVHVPFTACLTYIYSRMLIELSITAVIVLISFHFQIKYLTNNRLYWGSTE